MKAISWFEAVAEFFEEDCASYGRLAWAAKDKIVEALSEGAPLTKRAPRYPTLLLVKMERYVLDEGEPSALRVMAWIKLLKSWACLRWSDLQATTPSELQLTEGRLATVLRKTKPSGPNKRVKELPACVSKAAFYEDPKWLEAGFQPLRELASYKRDYRADLAVFERKMASYGDAMVASGALLARLQLPGLVQGFWTERSEKSVLPAALSIIGMQLPEKDLLGR